MPYPAPFLPYESPPDNSPLRRPWWVYILVAVYLIALAAMFLVPAFAASKAARGDLPFIALLTAYACALAICGLSLLLLPVRALRRRPIHRRSIWFPIIGSGLLAGILILGAGLALGELFRAGDRFAWAVIAASLIVWIAWAILFSLIVFRAGPERIGGKLHRFLIKGSVLELLIAIPSHVIVRQRGDCCAGIETGMGIAIGVSVMFISLGPSVLLLYYRRRKQILPPSHLKQNNRM